MIKPIFTVVAVMFISWGLAFGVNSMRHGDSSTDIVVECLRCHTRQRIAPAPLFACYDCSRLQTARVVKGD